MRAAILKWLAVALLAALAVFLVVKAYETWRAGVWAEGDRAGAARVQALWDEQDRQRAAQALDAAHRSAAETLRRLNTQQENQRAQDRLLAQVRSDAAGAAAAADGLRLRAASYLAAAGCSTRSGDSALECIRQAVAALGDALGHCGQIARRVAEDADDARARGLKCEADYDSLALKLSP